MRAEGGGKERKKNFTPKKLVKKKFEPENKY